MSFSVAQLHEQAVTAVLHEWRPRQIVAHLSSCAMDLTVSAVMLGLFRTLSSITSACLCSCASLAYITGRHLRRHARSDVL